ncbi:hypothetical protein A4V01_20545 [Erysipelotrichaceae bacterium I46]|uniref:hypothetical protein n=1 Tax=Clostridium innocuum TaxID=1522 RepID=UPI00080C96E2|nr:hypothetical protein [[Clostridium] innocuum]ANU71136.1 hypothetical protein A4V01_20545 [Erysipelotrichaceae bacterium I46]ASU20377.1 hypothetical protein ADH65_18675 [[Clostridium] innocuum]QQR24991.1 hypothetical protein I5Q87_13850 [[Clostridium] innocuum]
MTLTPTVKRLLAVTASLAMALSLAACGTAKTGGEAPGHRITLTITADKGWDENSTPAIVHIKGLDEDNASVDFYHAVKADKDGNKGTSEVEVDKGRYDIDVISPVNKDGSAYELFDTGDATEVAISDEQDEVTVDCQMTFISADKVTDDMLKAIVTDTKTAVENGDSTLKGDNGKAILDKLDNNVNANPNASDETKEDASKADEEVNVDSEPADTTSKPADKPSDGNANSSSSNSSSSNSGNSNSGNSGNSNSNSGSSSNTGNSSGSDKPSKPAHQHSWKQHTAQKWVSNMVTVPDYETQKVVVGNRYIFAHDGYTTDNINNAKAHAKELILAGLPDNYRTETIYEEKQVQVGSHQEDHGHNETYVDYEYCDCGARR